MNIALHEDAGITVIAIAGDIDMQSSPQLRKELMALVENKITPIHADFTEVSYIDSSGIATFVEGLKGMLAYGGKLRLVGIPERIMEIFHFAKLDKVFEIKESGNDVQAG
jgi:anti-sigma B factor antagonist